MRKLSSEEFISKAKKVHGDKFDYHEVEFIDTKVKVKIICPVHGTFMQIPSCHLQGRGCSKCRNEAFSKKYKFDNKQFIESLHPSYVNMYDFSQCKYDGDNKKVKVICKEHGPFMATPRHMPKKNGNGHISQLCPICMKIERKKHCIDMLSIQGISIPTTEEFIARIPLSYRKKFSFDKLVYRGGNNKVIITCPKHGDFLILASNIPTITNKKRGNLCAKCFLEKICGNTESFIKQAENMNVKGISFEKVKYVRSNIKVCMTCAKHGDFWIRPNDFLSGYSCRKCNSSKGEMSVEESLKSISSNYKCQVKIPECKHVHALPFDFGIFDAYDNIIGLIEYQGEQHYHPIKAWGGTKTLERIRKNDGIKADYCENKKIPLLLICYKNFEDIEKLVGLFYKSLQNELHQDIMNYRFGETPLGIITG